MLADVLDGAREQLADELDRQTAGVGFTKRPGVRRRKDQFRALLHEVIEALRGERLDDSVPPARLTPDGDEAGGVRDRELVKRYLLTQIEQRHLEVSADETAVVAGWPGRSERQRLREQNQRLAALLDEVNESAALLAPDGRILYCNVRAFQRLNALTNAGRDEIIGRTFTEIGVPSELVVGCPVERLVSMARARQAVEMHLLGRTKESQFDAVYGPDGSVGAVAVLIRDVHNRKLAEMRLSLLTKLSALVGMSDPDRFAEALVQVPIPALADWCTINLVEDGRIRRTFIGYRDPSKASLRDAIARVLPSYDRHPLWQELMPGGFQLLAEVTDDLLRRLATSEEHYRLLEQVGIRSLMVVPVAARGQIIAILSFAYTAESGRRYDRDDPALAEELALHAAHAFENARLMKDLRSSEARFRIALAGARTAVFEQDASLRYVWSYNPMTPEEVAGKTHEDAYPPEEAAMLTKLKRPVVERGENVQQEVDATFGSSEMRHYLETIEPVRDEAGKVVGLIGAASDITEQHRMRQQLTEELRFREQMMGVLSHDLRNPLNTIGIAVELILRSEALPQTGRDQAVRIRRSANRMGEMIDTLLDFTRMRFLRNVVLSPKLTDLSEISRDAIDEMRVAWSDQQIELDVHGDAHGEWDPARISQTIVNLTSNAITHGEGGTPVRVSVEGEDGEVTLKVHNFGPPIPPALMPTIFEPFRRGLEDRSPMGLGLGLYIVEQIVHAHRGTINVESTAEDGTTFTMRLPRAQGVPGQMPGAGR